MGTVSDTEDQATDISISWVSNLDGEFSTQGADINQNLFLNTNTLSAGNHTISVTATDSVGLMSNQMLNLRVNTPPTAPSVVIVPNPAVTDDNLIASASGSVDAKRMQSPTPMSGQRMAPQPGTPPQLSTQM